MENIKHFTITKNELNNAITYLECERKGFGVKPKKNITFEDMVKVQQMVIINPSLIENLVEKKCKIKLKKILEMASYIYNDDDEDSGTGSLDEVLNEIKKFKILLSSKYKEYIKQKEYNTLLKKMDIIESEVKLRKIAKISLEENTKKNKKGKGR